MRAGVGLHVSTTAFPRAKYCDEYVCLSVCLSVYALTYLENYTVELQRIFRAC